MIFIQKTENSEQYKKKKDNRAQGIIRCQFND